MTASENLKVVSFAFDEQAEAALPRRDKRFANWPAVYILCSETERLAYVGESLNVARRVGQHYASPDKAALRTSTGAKESRIILDGSFNKSAALDLEAFLIQHLAGDGHYELLNRNDGIVDRDYYHRSRYQQRFRDVVFRKLREQGVFRRNLEEIENDDLFKLSPYKSLEPSQEHAVKSVLQIVLKELEQEFSAGPIVVEGDPGTGKTIIAVFLMKLLVDIATMSTEELLDERDRDSEFPEFFIEENRQSLRSLLTEGRGIALVVPQQSLRESIQRVFRKIPNLGEELVIDPFSVGKSDEKFSFLVVDESHRLNQRANQTAGPRNKQFSDINYRLFGDEEGWETKTQLDWMKTQSRHQVLLLDRAQSVRPADLPRPVLDKLVGEAQQQGKHHELISQMRVQGGNDYIEYVQRVLSPDPPRPSRFNGYEFEFFDDPAIMHEAIRERDREFGLARMAAGFAWPWISKNKNKRDAYDIQIGHYSARWNSVPKDWVDSENSLEEVGSIHTLQGYDLNYAGVIIGKDLRLNEESGRLVFDRSNYFDKKGMERNKYYGRDWTHDELLQWVLNVYFVLLTRGRLGTFVYVCDEPLREYIRTFVRADLQYFTGAYTEKHSNQNAQHTLGGQ